MMDNVRIDNSSLAALERQAQAKETKEAAAKAKSEAKATKAKPGAGGHGKDTTSDTPTTTGEHSIFRMNLQGHAAIKTIEYSEFARSNALVDPALPLIVLNASQAITAHSEVEALKLSSLLFRARSTTLPSWQQVNAATEEIKDGQALHAQMKTLSPQPEAMINVDKHAASSISWTVRCWTKSVT